MGDSFAVGGGTFQIARIAASSRNVPGCTRYCGYPIAHPEWCHPPRFSDFHPCKGSNAALNDLKAGLMAYFDHFKNQFLSGNGVFCSKCAILKKNL